MPVAALTPKNFVVRRMMFFGWMVGRPAFAIALAYCVFSHLSFQWSFDGSLSMSRAAQLTLVSADFAARHPTKRVLFERVGPGVFEYRVPSPLVGYAGIPWLVARHTTIDLRRSCHAEPAGCKQLEPR